MPRQTVSGSPKISVVLPTFNEREALRILGPRLSRSLAEFDSEVIVVDDASPDGTANVVEELGRMGPFRLISRPSRRGLASAVLDGFAQARGDVVAVMDADGSHPPERLPDVLRPVLSGEVEFAIVSRGVKGGDYGDLEPSRRIVSAIASWLVRPLTTVHDPMSGFFAFDRKILDRASLAPTGFKIGLEIMVRCRPVGIREVPYHFAPRLAGASKLGPEEIGGFLIHLARLYATSLGPSRRASRTR